MIPNNYNLGDSIGPLECNITKEDVIEFVSINSSREGLKRFTSIKHAKSEKFPESIIPGNMHLIIISNFLTNSFQSVSIKKIDMIFRHIVKQNIQLTIKGFITNLFYENNIENYGCDITIENSEGIILIIATAQFILQENSTG